MHKNDVDDIVRRTRANEPQNDKERKLVENKCI